MARNDIQVNASPERVFEVLSDPDSYGEWVVGSSEIRDAEGGWPSEGATFHHTQGLPKIGIKDTTTVMESRSPEYLRLCVRARPVVIADVRLQLIRSGRTTRVEMIEEPIGGYLGAVHNPVFDLGLRLRNAESLRRLKRLAETRS
jgi:uncharacterized protein YndB with AHSA1/START domain